MSAAVDAVSWSVRRWAGVTLIILIVQCLLVFGLSRRGFADARMAARRTTARVVMVMGASQEERLMAAVGGFDPALFAVAHWAGFSARDAAAPSANAPVLASLLEPPHWLQGSLALLDAGSATNRGAAEGAPRPSEFMAVDRPSTDFSGLAGGSISPARETRVRVGGALARRPIVRGETAPALAVPQVIRSSVVGVGVDAEGFVQSARLLDLSDSPAADLEALKHARKIRFKSDTGTNRVGALDWGTISYSWQISDASTTNRVF